MLLSYCRTICIDYHLAQDAVQETAMIAFRKLHLYFGEADFAAWLKAIARREALSARRKRLGALSNVVERLIESAFDDPSVEDAGPEREALARCLEGLGQHDARAARVVHEHYYKGLPLAQIGAALATNLNTVKTILHRARLTLEECVRRRTVEVNS
jgi:RNA polymerase sigma-70 factor (ECF subfamily)